MMDSVPSVSYRLHTLNENTGAAMVQTFNQIQGVKKLASLSIHGKTKGKRGKDAVAAPKTTRPLNSWIAFRSKY